MRTPTPACINALALSPDAQFLALACAREPRLGRWTVHSDARNCILLYPISDLKSKGDESACEEDSDDASADSSVDSSDDSSDNGSDESGDDASDSASENGSDSSSKDSESDLDEKPLNASE